MEAHAIPRLRAPVGRSPVRHALLSDERLARLVGAGDERAFAVLYERYHQSLYRYCRSMLRHEADAQDALQSAFAGAYAALQRAQRDAPVRPWLFRIAHNESISLLRRRRPDAELMEDSGPAVSSVEDLGGQRARLAQLVADLRELPERQRGALVMRELSGLSHEDIASALGTTVGGAKQAIFEARRALLECAEGRAMECNEVCGVLSDADGRVLRGRRVRAHIRDCAACAAFAAAVPVRSADLRALAPPLPAVAAAGLLARVLGGATSVGGGGAAGVGGGVMGLGGGAGIAGLGGKTATVALATKAIGGLAVVSAATVGITSAVEHQSAVHQSAVHQSAPASQPAHPAAGNSPASPASGLYSVGLKHVATTPAAVRAFGAQGQAMSSTHGAAKPTSPGSTRRQLVKPAASNHAPSGSHGTVSTTVSRAGTVPGQTIRQSYGQPLNSQSQNGQSSNTKSSSGHSSSTHSGALHAQSKSKHVVMTPLGLIPPGL